MWKRQQEQTDELWDKTATIIDLKEKLHELNMLLPNMNASIVQLEYQIPSLIKDKLNLKKRLEEES